MSLINDALKRAQQAQQENPPPTPDLEFRPVAAGQNPPARRTTWLVLGLTLVIVLLLGMAGTLLWFVTQTNSAPLHIAARKTDAPLPAPQSEVAPLATISTPTLLPEPPLAPAPTEQFDHPDEPNTNRVPVAELTAPDAAPALKLQGIFFNPSAPSVVVNGKTAYLGDRVNGFRLVAVSPVAATFVSATATNVLSLSEQ